MIQTLKKVGVIGDPISHSISPIIHRHWIDENAIPAVYEKIHVTGNRLSDFVDTARNTMVGFNVTVPHKEAILPLCDVLSDTAHSIGAVNTVVIKGGKIYGDNTDAYGLQYALENSLRTQGVDLYRNHVCILGAGGAGRACIYAMQKMGFNKITLVNRTFSKAQSLAYTYGVDCETMENIADVFACADLVVNTTIAGMSGQNIVTLPIEALRKHAIVYDIVYTPLQTPMLQSAHAYGLTTVQGLDMLLYQAVGGFKQWFGVDVTVNDRLRKKVLGI